jgi:MFS family permease
VALVAVFLGAIDLTVVATILPSMISDLGINTADIDRYIWVVNSYLIAYVVSIPLVGRMADLVGVRAVFIAAMVVFMVGSSWCATADSLQDLVMARAIQGFGGGALLPIALAVVAQSFTGAHRAQAVGAVGAVDTLGWVSGPAYGAFVASQLTFVDDPWRLVFWINVPFALLLLPMARLLPSQDNDSTLLARLGNLPGKLDVPGFVLIGATAGRGLRAFGGTPNPLAERILLLLAVAAVALVVFAWRIRSGNDTFLPRRLLSNASYRASLAANALLGTVLMTGMVNVPIMVALVESGADPGVRSAVLLAPFTLAIAISSILAGRFLRRHSARSIVTIGLLLTVMGNLSVFPLLTFPDYRWMAIGLAVAGAGIGLALTPLSATALDSSASTSYGVAAATLLVFRLLGMTVGISLLTSLGVQRLQVLTGALEPVAQTEAESTAEFLLRQQEYIVARAVPLGVQVVQETFVVAAILSGCALIAARRLSRAAALSPP